MAQKLPLVLDSGMIRQLAADDQLILPNFDFPTTDGDIGDRLVTTPEELETIWPEILDI